VIPSREMAQNSRVLHRVPAEKVANNKRLRHFDAILVMHRYVVAGVSVGGLVADVAHLHGRRQGKTDQKEQRPPSRVAVFILYYSTVYSACSTPTLHCAL